MSIMGSLFLLLAIAMGVATFIENDFGTPAAKALVYNSWWFELGFLLLAINMLTNLFKHKLLSMSRLSFTLFHFSFLIIIVGAAITRYISYEGVLHIREGEQSNTMLSAEPFLTVKTSFNDDTELSQKKSYLSPITPYEYSQKFSNGLRIKSMSFTPNALLQAVDAEGGIPMITIVGSSSMGRIDKTLAPHDSIVLGGLTFAFQSSTPSANRIELTLQNNQLFFQYDQDALMIQMQTSHTDTLLANQQHPLYSGVMYRIGDDAFVLKDFKLSAALKPVYQPNLKGLPSAVTLEITKGDESTTLVVMGAEGETGQLATTTFQGISIEASYGAISMPLPFSLKLNDFIIDRYPGSQSPSSFASEVTLIDTPNNVHKDERIFMNNILNYRGYRFFQSSYDSDEKGTILSVNHDHIGTLVTYIGYALLALGLMLALIMPGTRFRWLYRQTGQLAKERKALTLLILLALPFVGNAQVAAKTYSVSDEIGKTFGTLWVQDHGGRIEPMNTLNNEIARKLVKHNSFQGLSADQLVLSMMINQEYWRSFPTITVAHPELRRILNVTEKKATFRQFFASDGAYIIGKAVEEAVRHKPSERDKFEQELIKVDEQVNVIYLVQTGQFLHIFPNPEGVDQPWVSPGNSALKNYHQGDSLFVANVFSMLVDAIQNNNSVESKKYLEGILAFQLKTAKHPLPDTFVKNAEIFYNGLNLFLYLSTIFFALGFLFITFQFMVLLVPRWNQPWLSTTFFILILVAFIAHTCGLGMRWIISGHAPWSNGYESMLYIGWTTLLAGVLFYRRNAIALSVSSLFTGVILMVAHLSWMNPEITNLVPVLKSYWLTIHVAVIVASYGFLGLGALLGFISLILMGLKQTQGNSSIKLTLSELTAINEMTLTVGLYLITIGAFLGGVWANESWGRYWGWDPKETWSAVTILIYALVLHMRFIPGLKSQYAYTLASVVAFSSVVMTYLGVNYYLAGMHSYAKGDPIPIPVFVYYVVTIVTVVAIYAWLMVRKRNHEKNSEN